MKRFIKRRMTEKGPVRQGAVPCLVGVVAAIPDKPNHICVYPLGGTMEDWYNAGPNSKWSLAVESVCIKWDGK